MDVIDIRPDLRMMVSAPGQAYLLRHTTGVLLVDTGCVGDGAAIAGALRDWGLDRADLTDVVLTHWHADHAGSAAEISQWPGVRIVAHRADAPVIRGDQVAEDPVFTEAEKDLHAQVAADVVDAPPARIDRELNDGDLLPGIGARVISTPGHTAGSMALHLADSGVLFTGDIAAEHHGRVILGPFNTDRELARQSFRRLGGLDMDAVCFGHGQPLIGADVTALREATAASTVPDPLA